MLCRLPLIVALSIGYVCAQVQIPNSPAGQTLRAWLDAFNSGDRARMEAVVQKFGPKLSGSPVTLDPGAGVDAMMRLRDATGSLEFLAIDKITPAGAESPIGLYTRSFLARVGRSGPTSSFGSSRKQASKPQSASWT